SSQRAKRRLLLNRSRIGTLLPAAVSTLSGDNHQLHGQASFQLPDRLPSAFAVKDFRVPPILRLALPSPLRTLFDYRPPAGVPHAALQPGVRLRVPFGRREVVGVLVEVVTHSEVPEAKLKPALELLDSVPPLPPALFKLCLWTAQYYQHSLGDTFSWALPVLLRQGEPAEARQERFWHAATGARADDSRLSRAPRQRDALKTIAQHPQGVAHSLLGQLQLSRDSLDQLLRKGLVRLETRRTHQVRSHQGSWLLQPELPLNQEQRAAFEAI